MQYEIQCQPSYSVLEVQLQPGEQVVTEAGAMVWMSDNLNVTTSMRGGLFSGLKRSVLAGESFFQNTYVAEGGAGLLGLAPGQPGDIVPYALDHSELYLERGAYLASDPDVECNSDFQGLRGLFNEGLFILRVAGTGTVFFNGYGDIEGGSGQWHLRCGQRPCRRLGADSGIRADQGPAHPVIPLLGPAPDALPWAGSPVGAIAQSALLRKLDLSLPAGEVVGLTPTPQGPGVGSLPCASARGRAREGANSRGADSPSLQGRGRGLGAIPAPLWPPRSAGGRGFRPAPE